MEVLLKDSQENRTSNAGAGSGQVSGTGSRSPLRPVDANGASPSSCNPMVYLMILQDISLTIV